VSGEDDSQFSSVFFGIQQECYSIAAQLTQGLTALGRSTIADKGQCYPAFFGLSVGLERLFKLVLNLDHMAENSGKALGSKALRKLGGDSGHDLVALLDQVGQIAERLGLKEAADLKLSGIQADILKLISDFGDAFSRYANIDHISGEANARDPLVPWQAVLERIVQEEVPANRREAILKQAQKVARAFEGHAIARFHSFDHRLLSMEELMALPGLQGEAARRAVVHVLRIVRASVRVLEQASDRATASTGHLGDKVMVIPDVRDFFRFVWVADRDALRKKRWP
jgi:hypothetical protein